MTGSEYVTGIYQSGQSSEAFRASAVIYDDGSVRITALDDRTTLHSACDRELHHGDVIPGVPVELIFADASRFIPDDPSWRWPGINVAKTLPAWLEAHWSTVLGAVILVPAFIWLMITWVIPAGADVAAELLPDSVAETLGKQTLLMIDNTYMEPSQISAGQQQQIRQRWATALTNLGLPAQKFTLEFRHWTLGPNALALADGHIILTDDIVTLMAAQPQYLDAVMLHEIGHVMHKHSLKQLSQATAMSMLYAMMFGDIEGAGEIILGLGTSLAQSAFSRDMEREADQYAYQQLARLGRPVSDFSAALTLLENHYVAADDDKQKHPRWIDYLSSHPGTDERIRAAEKQR